METVYRDYSPKGVQFYYVYKALAHPENNGYVTPFTLKERLMHVQEAQRTLGSRIPWICDTMDNSLKHALGNAPNSEFILDPDGVLVRKRAWSNPSDLRKDLEELVGPVAKQTQVADLDMPKPPPSERVASGVVPRVRLPGRLRPLVVEPVEAGNDLPFYAKLRAEADSSVANARSGKLYLGFFLDPLYHVHWNNKADPLRFELDTPDGWEVSPASGQGPHVDQDADCDPREFLIDVTAAKTDKPSPDAAIRVTVHYFACDDADTFCVPVKQQYVVKLQTDPDGGSRMTRRGPRPPSNAGPRDMIARMMQRDQDGDKRISRAEAPERMGPMFDRMDANRDGFLDQQEMQTMARRRGGRGGGPAGPAGGRPGGMPFSPPFGGGPPPPEDFRAMMMRSRAVFSTLDQDGDGALSADEIQQAAKALRKLDKNGDGRIAPDEMQPRR